MEDNHDTDHSHSSETSSLVGKSSSDEDPLVETDFEKHKNISFLRLALVTCCFFGIQFGWALQISQLTPFILELGLPKVLVTLVWLCGPIAGLLVQPIVGAVSDRTNSRLGRRRPYILTGAIFVIIALILIPNSLDIGRWFGDTPGKHPVALVLAVAGFWILDFANNMLQGPCRALVADIAGPEQQELGNSIFSLWIALGSVTGYIAGWISWSEYISFMRTEACQAACEDLRVSFIISIVLLIVTTIITLVSAKERPLDEIDDELNRTKQPPSPTGEEHESIKKVNPILKMLSILFKMPQPMLRVCFVQFFAWFGWFTFLIYGTDWVGENIYHGNPDSKHPAYHLYQEGVRWGSFGLAGFAFVSLIFSPIVPALTNRFGTKPVYFVCNALLVVALFLPVIVRNKYVALLTLSLFGIPWSITMTIPFAIVANIAPEEEKGIYMGILNIFVVLPQLCMSAVGALLSYLSNGNVVSAFGAGAVSAFLACLLTLFLIIPTKMHKKKKKRKPSKTQEQLLTLTAQSTPGSPTTVYSNV